MFQRSFRFSPHLFSPYVGWWSQPPTEKATLPFTVFFAWIGTIAWFSWQLLPTSDDNYQTHIGLTIDTTPRYGLDRWQVHCHPTLGSHSQPKDRIMRQVCGGKGAPSLEFGDQFMQKMPCAVDSHRCRSRFHAHRENLRGDCKGRGDKGCWTVIS